MDSYAFCTVDVFTGQRFGGNPLAVFPDARGLSDRQMQALAAEFNLSETTFVLPPDDPANTARVRIFNRTNEMPFAGHPNVGTAFVMAQAGRDRDGLLRFEEMAGLVEARVERDPAGEVAGATIHAPQALSLGVSLEAAEVAACAALDPASILTTAHAPVVASMGVAFVIAEVAPEALGRAAPVLEAFRRLRDARFGKDGRLAIHLYAYDGERVRARMFSPLAGTYEDAATGSANAALAGLLLQLAGGSERSIEVAQGVEMGRPSLLRVRAFRGPGGVRATVGGTCVPVLRGVALA